MTKDSTTQSPACYDPFAIPKPAWQDWKQTTRAPLWKAVALILDIDPLHIANPHNRDQLASFPGHVPESVQDMLQLARNAAASGRLKLYAGTADGLEYGQVDLAQFSEWAGSLGYTVPMEFPQRNTKAPLHISGWPWGQYDTKLLRVLAAAANKFWKYYDPEDPTTAPTNAEVVGWLCQEHQVAGRTAEVMATILRADRLPTGPRK